MHVDHVKPIKRKHTYNRTTKKWTKLNEVKYPERDVMDNMLPSCASCNILKGSKYLETFRKNIVKQLNKFEKKHAGFRLLMRFNLVEVNRELPIKFYFELMEEL